MSAPTVLPKVAPVKSNASILSNAPAPKIFVSIEIEELVPVIFTLSSPAELFPPLIVKLLTFEKSKEKVSFPSKPFILVGSSPLIVKLSLADDKFRFSNSLNLLKSKSPVTALVPKDKVSFPPASAIFANSFLNALNSVVSSNVIVSSEADKFNVSIPFTSIKFAESIVPLFVIFKVSVPETPLSDILSDISKLPIVTFISSLPSPRLTVSFPLERVNVSFADVPTIFSFPVESVIDKFPPKLFVIPLKFKVSPLATVIVIDVPERVMLPLVLLSKLVISEAVALLPLIVNVYAFTCASDNAEFNADAVSAVILAAVTTPLVTSAIASACVAVTVPVIVTASSPSPLYCPAFVTYTFNKSA